MWLLYFCFSTSDSVTKKKSASEYDFLLSNLFLQLISPTSCMTFFSGCHLFQIHPGYFLNSSHCEKIKQYSGKISFSWFKAKNHSTHQGVRWAPAPAERKQGDSLLAATRYQISKFGTSVLLFNPHAPLVNISLLLLHSLVHKDISMLLTNTLKMMGKFFHYSNKKSYFTEREVLHQCLKIKSHCFCKTLYWHIVGFIPPCNSTGRSRSVSTHNKVEVCSSSGGQRW